MRAGKIAKSSVFVPVFLLLITATPNAIAQEKSTVRAGSFEIGPFLGASYGIDKFHFMGGGNATFAVNKYVLPYVEFSYFPGIGHSSSGIFPGTGRPYTTSYSIPFSDFHGGVHIRLPIFREKPVVPYLVFGLGGLKHFNSTVDALINDGTSVSKLQVTVPGGTDFAINTGGGIRFYIGQHFGLRAEAKAYKPTGDINQVFGKVEGGFFFQLR